MQIWAAAITQNPVSSNISETNQVRNLKKCLPYGFQGQRLQQNICYQHHENILISIKFDANFSRCILS